MANSTPGPWLIDDRAFWDKEIIIRAEADGWHRMRCDVDYDDCDPDTAEANARLIAAAPDLLEVAKAMIPANLCVTNPNVRDDTIVPLEVTMGELRKIAAALTKAEPR